MRGLVWMLMLTMATTAAASPGTVKKADKLYQAFRGGEREALAEAWAVLEPAMGHAKVAEDPAAWLLVAQVQYERGASSRELDTLSAANDAAANALRFEPSDPQAEAAIAVLKSTQGILVASMTDALASKQHDRAWEVLQAVVAGRESLASRDIVLRGLEEKLLRAAIIASVKSGHVDAAVTHHAAFFEQGFFDAGLASMIAKELGQSDGEAAVAFLTPLREEYPGDERLLRAHVGLLMEEPEEAKAVIDSAKEQLWPSVSGALLLAELYDEVGADEASVEAYRQVLSIDATHRDALVRSARQASREADAKAAELEGPDLSRSDRRALDKAIASLRAEVVEQLERAREAHGRDREVLVALKAAYEANKDDDAAIEVQGAIDALEAE